MRSLQLKGRARVDRGDDIIVGVNKYPPPTESQVDVLVIDNTKVRQQQLARIKKIQAERDSKKVQQALENLRQVCNDDTQNILSCAIEAARVRATLGEISDALESVFGRHHAQSQTIGGCLWFSIFYR